MSQRVSSQVSEIPDQMLAFLCYHPLPNTGTNNVSYLAANFLPGGHKQRAKYAIFWSSFYSSEAALQESGMKNKDQGIM